MKLVCCALLLVYAGGSHAFKWPSRFPPFTKLLEQSFVGGESAGEPLLLTPLIDAGRLAEAKNRSRVTPPLLRNVDSYTGYLTVNRTTLSHLFFWYIPKTRTDYTSSPLILWLNGGPGCTSLLGLFNENGSFKVTKDGSLRKRVHAWSDHYHMLYIDQPVGTGFSYTEYERGYIRTEERVGDTLYEALTQFYRIFPALRDHDFFIAGESYAGKYVPALGYKIYTEAKRGRKRVPPLKGMMIGNGYSDPENMQDYATLLHGVGLIDDSVRVEMEATQEKIKYLFQSDKWESALAMEDKLSEIMENAINSTNLYDYTRDHSDEYDDAFVRFVTRDDTRKRLHVGRVVYNPMSWRVANEFRWDETRSVRPWIEELLEHYPMLFYSGQFDIIVGHTLTENFLRNLRWSGASKYGSAKRQLWRVGRTLAGFYKSAANLVYALVRNAGHMVPQSQPKNALNLIDLFIEKKLHDNSTVDSVVED